MKRKRHIHVSKSQSPSSKTATSARTRCSSSISLSLFPFPQRLKPVPPFLYIRFSWRSTDQINTSLNKNNNNNKAVFLKKNCSGNSFLLQFALPEALAGDFLTVIGFVFPTSVLRL